MNKQQVMGIVRAAMSTISGIAMAYGVGDNEAWISITAGVIAIAAIIWSVFSNTDQSALNQTADNPDVHKIVVTPSAVFASDNMKVVSK